MLMEEVSGTESVEDALNVLNVAYVVREGAVVELKDVLAAGVALELPELLQEREMLPVAEVEMDAVSVLEVSSKILAFRELVTVGLKLIDQLGDALGDSL